MGGLTDASKFNSYNGFTAGSDDLENSPLKFNSMGWTAGKEFLFSDHDYFTPIRQFGPENDNNNNSFGFYYDTKDRKYHAAYKDATGNLIKDRDIPESILDQLSTDDIAKIFEKGGYNQNAYETNFTKEPYSNWNDDAKRFAISDYITAHFNPNYIKGKEIPQTAKPLDPVKKEDTSQATEPSDPVKTAASVQGSSDLKDIQAYYGPRIQKAYETGDVTSYHNLQLAMRNALHDGKLWGQDSYIDPKGNLQKLHGIYGLEGHPEWEDYQKPNDASVSNAGGISDKVSEVSDTKSGETSNTTQPIRDTKTNTSILDYLMADKMLQDDRTAQLTKDKDIGLIPMLLAAYGMGKIM